jgi:hypothetical protein
MRFIRRVAAIPRRVATLAIDGWRRHRALVALRSHLPIPADRTFATIVAMPGGVHMADLAMAKVEGFLPILCVLNGVSAPERAYLATRHPAAHFAATPHVLRHHDVINAVIEVSPRDFWLVDHDCIVLQPEALRAAEEVSAGAIGAVFFADANAETGFTKPHTFLMLIRPRVAKDIFRRFGVDASPLTWRQLPDGARRACESVGLSATRLPEPGKPYFDTLCAAAACAASQGVGFHIMNTYTAMFCPHPEAVHFGHTSTPVFKPDWLYGALGAYFWRAALERHAGADLCDLYRDRLASLPPLDEMRRALIAQDTPYADATVLDSIDALCAGSGPNGRT